METLRFIRDNTFLDDEEKPDFFLYLILLNRPFVKQMFVDLHSKISFFICADGGTNYLYDSFSSDEER